MPIVSISLTSQILKSLDKIIEERGYFSRSEAIRDAIRGIILEYDLSLRDNDLVFAAIITINEYDRHDIEKKLSKLRHEFNDIVIEVTHRHIKDQYCIEIFLVEGKNSEVTNLLARIRGIRGLNQIKFIILPLL